MLGFASGIMIAASVWSLLIPSMKLAEDKGIVKYIPASVGFLLGIGFLLLLDSVIPHLHLDSNQPEGVKSSLSKSTMLVLAVTLHNIPEGMAVGITFASAMMKDTSISIAGAFSLADEEVKKEYDVLDEEFKKVQEEIDVRKMSN